ncbi:MAG TPA: hypothetical protein VGL62_07975 [Vicinamibacterales bacterium]|jgi:hypothetical protein
MTHLTDRELVEAAERTLPAARAAHLDGCPRCRIAAGELAASLREIASADVPDPSPLFWEHFSTRVREAVDADAAPPQPSWRGSLRAHWIQIAAACGVLIAVASGAWMVRQPRQSVATTLAQTTRGDGAAAVAAGASSAALQVADASSDDAAWDVLSAAAADLQIDDARQAGFGVRPAAIDNAVLKLTPAERNELGRLLQDELKHASN